LPSGTPFSFHGVIIDPRAVHPSMISLLDRDLVADLARTLLTLLGLMAILFMADTLVGWLGAAGDKAGLHWMLVYYVLRLPSFFLDVAAVAAAASVLWVAARKARTNELLAWMAGGISPRRIAAPLILAGVAAAALTFVCQETFAYRWRRTAGQVEEVYRSGKDTSQLARSENIYQRLGKGRIVAIDAFNSAEETMEGITVVDLYPKAYAPNRIVRAARAVRPEGIADGLWRFEEASVRTFGKDGTMASFERLPELEFELDAEVARFLGNVDDPETMTAFELWRYAKLVDAQGKDTAHLRALLHQKLALPAGIAVIVLVMCAHSISARAMGAIAGFGGGLVWMAGYYGAVAMSRKIADANVDLSPILVAWLPNLAFGGWGIFAMARR